MSDQAPNQPDPRERYRGFESVPVAIAVRVGRVRLKVGQLARLAIGTVLQLDRAVGQPFELIAEGRTLGEVEPLAAGDELRLKLISVAAEEVDRGVV